MLSWFHPGAVASRRASSTNSSLQPASPRTKAAPRSAILPPPSLRAPFWLGRPDWASGSCPVRSLRHPTPGGPACAISGREGWLADALPARRGPNHQQRHRWRIPSGTGTARSRILTGVGAANLGVQGHISDREECCREPSLPAVVPTPIVRGVGHGNTSRHLSLRARLSGIRCAVGRSRAGRAG